MMMESAARPTKKRRRQGTACKDQASKVINGFLHTWFDADTTDDQIHAAVTDPGYAALLTAGLGDEHHADMVSLLL